MHRRTHELMVLLQDTGGLHMVPVPVGSAEASALIIGLEKNGLWEPLPHDMLLDFFSTHRFILQSVLFRLEANNSVRSTLQYRFRGRRYEMAVRPGDALTIAARIALPMLVPTSDLSRCACLGISNSLDAFSQDVILLGRDTAG